MPAQLSSPPKLPKMELIPPREAEVEGVFRSPGSAHHGRIIYTQRVLDVEATKASAKIKLDAQGNEVWKKHPTTGEAQYPMLVKETKYKDVRYVLHGQEIGRNVKKIYNFEPTAEELAALERREAERTWQETFFAEAAASGMSPAELIARIKRDTLSEGEHEDAVELDLTEEVVAERMKAAQADAEELISRPADEETVSVDETAAKAKRRSRKKAD